MSLVSEIRILIDEQSGGVFWTDSQVYNAANEAQIDVWAASGWDTIKTNFIVNPGDDLVAYDPVLMIPQYFLLNNKKYFPTTMAKLEQYDRQWKGTNRQQPKWFAQFDHTRFRVFPSPDAIYSFDLWGLRYPPTEISALALDITAPELVRRAVMYRAVARLTLATRPDIAAMMTTQAMEAINNWNIRIRNRQSNKIVRVYPGVDRRMHLQHRAQSGVIKLGRNYT